MNRVILALMLLAASIAQAAPVTFGFTGEVTNDPFGVLSGATFSGSYTFDSATPQVLSNPTQTGYADSGGLFQMTMSFAGSSDPALNGVAFTGDMLNITVTNGPGGDRYQVTGQSSLDSALTIEIDLQDPNGTAFFDTLLPTSPPSLLAFNQSIPFSFALFGGTLDNPVEAGGHLLTLTAVPEPATVLMLLPGIVLLALRFKRST